MAEYIVPWIGIGALVVVGLGINTGKAEDATVEENSRNGPPFYDCAGAQQLRMFGGRQFRKALHDNPPNMNGKEMDSEDAYRASEFIKQQSQKARIRAWEAATNHSHQIIVQPNSRVRYTIGAICGVLATLTFVFWREIETNLCYELVASPVVEPQWAARHGPYVQNW